MGPDSKRAILAVVISGIILFGWQSFFAPQNQQVPVQSPEQSVQAEVKESAKPVAETESKPLVPKAEIIKEETVTLQNDSQQFQITNNLSVLDIKNSDSKFTFHETLETEAPFQLQVWTPKGFRQIPFQFQKSTDPKVLEGENLEYEMNIKLALNDNGKISLNILSRSPQKYRLVFNSKEKELEGRRLREFLVYAKDVEREEVGDDLTGEGSVKWAGVDFNYHLFAYIFKNKTSVKYFADASGNLVLETNSATNVLEGDFIYVQKNYDKLKELGDSLDLAVDFGILGVLAVPILKGLQFIYNLTPNYGIAIILLTLLIRFIMFPLQYKSFKSMKKMQIIQPELKEIKERFKDDPKRMQQETMAAFKRAGANPLGGCLPMLLQMPIFLAFYRVLYAAVELVDAPFVGWIHDLSQKDPYFVLPILMGLSWLLMQKFTPSPSADPTQKKIMMAMPIVFTFIMKDLPSGLALYFFVSNVFSMGQQFIVYRTTK